MNRRQKFINFLGNFSWFIGIFGHKMWNARIYFTVIWLFRNICWLFWGWRRSRRRTMKNAGIYRFIASVMTFTYNARTLNSFTSKLNWKFEKKSLKFQSDDRQLRCCCCCCYCLDTQGSLSPLKIETKARENKNKQANKPTIHNFHSLWRIIQLEPVNIFILIKSTEFMYGVAKIIAELRVCFWTEF